MEVELMVTKRDDNRQPTIDDDRVNIEQSASGRWTGRVLQLGTQVDVGQEGSRHCQEGGVRWEANIVGR